MSGPVLAFLLAVAAQEPPRLFDLLPDVPDARALAGRPEVIRAQSALLRIDLLSRAEAGSRFTLDFFPDLEVQAVVGRVERRSAASYSVFGTTEGRPPGSFILSVEDDVLAADFEIHATGRHVALRYLGDQVYLIQEIDPSLVRGCLVESPPRIPGAPLRPHAEERAPPSGGIPVLGSCGPTHSYYDILIAYTAAARIGAGGLSAIEAKCQLAIDITNESYVNSLVPGRARLVYRGETVYDENGDCGDHLSRLNNSTDGIMDELHSLRNQYGCDQVSLLVTNAPSCCGIGYLPGAFTVTDEDCISSSGGYTFSHELGHNQGCHHDIANTSGPGWDPYSYGWRFFGNSGTQWRTVMSYAPGSRIKVFSNPNVLHDGQPTGVIGQAFNAQTVVNTSGIMEARRQTRFDVWVDFAYGGPESGSASQPYDSVAEGVNAIALGVGSSERPSVWLQPGSSLEALVITKPMVLRACGSPVTIGN